MNKKELIKRVAEKLGNSSQKLAAQAVEAVFESIADGLQEDGIVTIGKWGTYSAEDL
jgi:nucleoid DNA-binding protein